MIPVIKSSQSVAGGFKPKINQLNKRLRDETMRYDVSQYLHNYVAEQSLVEDTNYQSFYSKLTSALYMAMKQFDVFQTSNADPEVQEDLGSSYFCIINRQAFHRKQPPMNLEGFR